MLSADELTQLYFGDLYDFSKPEDGERLQRKNQDLIVEEHPMFSFMMCVYNDVRLLNSAINSLLKQEFTDWELIILDNSDRDDTAWNMLQCAAGADPRIRVYRSGQNEGWAKGAAILLQYARGRYTTFLAADDCIVAGKLKRLNGVIAEENPDVIWVGNALVSCSENSRIELLQELKPQYRVYDKNKRAAAIAEIMSTVYYNSFFHYMRVDFLKENGIDFFEPYYADCAGMTKAMEAADKMVVLDEMVYALTVNTSQTVGYYIWGCFDFVFANQWRCVKEVFVREQEQDLVYIQYIAKKILNNLLGNISVLCQNHCRNKYMNPIEKSAGEIVGQLEEVLACDEVAEMLQIADASHFENLLEKVSELKSIGIDLNSSIVRNTWLKPLLILALNQEELSVEEKVELLMSWLLEEKNPRCIGFDYCVTCMDAMEQGMLSRFSEQISRLADKYDNQSCKRLFYSLE